MSWWASISQTCLGVIGTRPGRHAPRGSRAAVRTGRMTTVQWSDRDWRYCIPVSTAVEFRKAAPCKMSGHPTVNTVCGRCSMDTQHLARWPHFGGAAGPWRWRRRGPDPRLPVRPPPSCSVRGLRLRGQSPAIGLDWTTNYDREKTRWVARATDRSAPGACRSTDEWPKPTMGTPIESVDRGGCLPPVGDQDF